MCCCFPCFLYCLFPMTRKKFIGFLLATIFIYSATCWHGSGEKVLIKNVEVLTLKEGQWSTGRRSSAVPQLMYKGGSAGKQYAPRTVQCYNRGHDGYDVQWECKADLPHEVRFGNINVVCEGYSYPDDPYILKGSCGLEYTLELTGEDHSNSYSKHYNHYDTGYSGHVHKRRGSDWSHLWVIGGVGLILYLVYTKCLAPETRSQQGQRSGESRSSHSERPTRNTMQSNAETVINVTPELYPDLDPPPYPGNGPSAPPYEDAPPAYGWAEDYSPDSKERTRTTASSGYASQSQERSVPRGNESPTRTETNTERNQDGPGFWSGASLGGILGYMFGSRGNRGYRQGYGGGWGSNWGGNGWGSNWGGNGWGSNWGGNSWGSRWNQPRQPTNQGSWWSSSRPQSSSWFGSSGSSSSGGSSWFGSGGSGQRSSGSRTASGFGGTSRR